jgi:hypothetical protein
MTSLNNRFVATPETYARVLDAIDIDIQREATEAELNRHGAGLMLVLERIEHAKSTTIGGLK